MKEVKSCVFIGNATVASTFPGLCRELEGWKDVRSSVWRCLQTLEPSLFVAVFGSAPATHGLLVLFVWDFNISSLNTLACSMVLTHQ